MMISTRIPEPSDKPERTKTVLVLSGQADKTNMIFVSIRFSIRILQKSGNLKEFLKNSDRKTTWLHLFTIFVTFQNIIAMITY
jgi:hypothetical protein